MLNRLIIAVFGIALVLALGSSVMADTGVQRGTPASVERITPSAPRQAGLAEQDVRPVQPAFKKPASALRALPPGTQMPGSPSLIYFCDQQDYSGAPYYVWTIPDAYGDDLFNTRFTADPNFDCSLKVAYIAMYEPYFTGSPDMRVYLWDDDGFGFPGAVLDSVDIPNATILAATGGGLGYVAADFSASGWVFSDGAEYHYGWTPIGGAGDTLCATSDQFDGPAVGEERSSEYYSGAWGSMLNDYGVDLCFNIVSERCCSEIPFSDCYVQSYAQNLGYFWRCPQQTYGDSAYAMRFDVGGPETLVNVDFYVYDDGSIDPAGNNDIYVTVYDDDGSGFPGSVITSATVPAGTYPFFPAVTSVSFAPLVVTNTFHVALSTNGTWDGAAGLGTDTYEAFLSSDGTDGTLRSSSYWAGGPWVAMADGGGWGLDVNFLIDAYLCRDEYSLCSIEDCSAGLAYFWRLPDRYGDYANAQKHRVKGAECRIDNVTWLMYWSGSEAALPLYTFDSKLSIYSDVAGYPGTELFSTTISVADYGAPAPGGGAFLLSKDVSGLDWTVTSDYWVALESNAPDTLTGIRTLSDNGGGGCQYGAAEYYGAWGYMADDWGGINPDFAFVMEVDQCCIPSPGRDCAPPDNWAAGSHDVGRSAASQLAIEDAWCDLTVDWYWETPANTIQFNAPVVYDGRVFVATEDGVGNNSTVETFDLYDGTHLATIAGAEFGNFMYNDPLIINNTMYIAGGDNRVISSWDVSTWGAPALNWSRALGGAVGPCRSSHLILLDVGGTDVIFGGSQTGRVFALNASDGLDFPGWAVNPITLIAGQLVRNACTDGSQLFYTCYVAGLDGDLFSVDPATGSINWSLATSAGLQGTTLGGIDTLVTSEAMSSMSYDDGVVYAGSYLTGNFPCDGVFYRINANDGSLAGDAVLNNRMIYNTFVVDVNAVYALTFTRWVGGTAGRPVLAFNKNSGAIVWQQSAVYNQDHLGGYRANGALSCEPELSAWPADILITNDINGNLNFWNSLTGDNLFYRRWDYGPGVSNGASASIGTDSSGAVHVLATSLFGGVVSLAKGADRPRLEIQDYSPEVPVEFSVSTSVMYSVPGILTNNGCADLTFNAVNVDTATFGSTDPQIVSVRPDLFDVTNTLAKQMTSHTKAFLANKDVNDESSAELSAISSIREQSYRNERGNRAAMALPDYLNSVVEPYAGQVVAAGDTIDLVLDINAANIKRGPQVFYIELDTDDPDFFLDAGSSFLPNDYPELVITCIGGCLTDSSTLEFGIGSSNYQFVFNTGMVGTVDGSGTPFGASIDGDNAALWMATYIYGVSQHRIAFHVDYFNGTWISWQADPNWCDNSCKPALSTGVSLGNIWDGAAYVPITGNMVCASGLDSVQNFDQGGGWDWDTPGPFDQDSTMGLYVNSHTFGAVDEPSLAHLTVEVLEFSERNGDSVPGWKFGFWADFDAHYFNGDGTLDTMQINRDYSAAWDAGNSLSGCAIGLIKLPFGCGHEPIKNAVTLDSDNSFYGTTSGNYLDSFYTYASRGPGLYSMPGITAATRDESGHITVTEHDFEPNGTYKFAVGLFGYTALASSDQNNAPEIEALANQANKWIGFGRGDVNDDNAINLGDIMTLAAIVNGSVPGAIPFEHLADVDADGDVDNADLQYLIDYYFNCGPCPQGDWLL